MPSLSERDLGHVEKLFKIAYSLLEYDSINRHPKRPAEAVSLSPSTALRDHQKHAGTALAASSTPGKSVAVAADNGISEQRLWTELSFSMKRVIVLQKLSLVSHVASDPGQMVTELARALLTFIKNSCVVATGNDREAKMHRVAQLTRSRVLFLLRVFCSLKTCTIMLSEVNVGNKAGMARKVFNDVCGHVVSGGHLSWMSLLYVWFCDEAARQAFCGSAIRSSLVYTTHDALRCILGCCTDNKECAKAFLYSEPVACVTYMFYGLKLRISTGDPLRPYEDEHFNPEKAEGVTAQTAGEVAVVTSESSRIQRDAIDFGPIPDRPPGARCLKTRYFTGLTPFTTQHPQRTLREGASAHEKKTAVASLVYPARSSPSGDPMSSSWALDLPGLSRPQLKELLLGSRQNAFDFLLFSALDVVVEAVHVTRDYGNWIVLSTVSNLLLLSKKIIDAGTVPEALASAPSAASTSEAAPRLSQVVAMHENIVVLFHFLLSLMQGIKTGKSSRPALESNSPASSTLDTVGTENVAQDKEGKDAPSLRGSLSPGGRRSPSQPTCLKSATGAHMSRTGPSPAVLALEKSAKDFLIKEAQLQEVLSQQILQMVLQTDLQSVFMATKRVLECDRTLFLVLHTFCMLDTQAPGHVKPPNKHSLQESFAGATAARCSAKGDGSGVKSAADVAAASFFVTSSCGDLRVVVNELGCSSAPDDDIDENVDLQPLGGQSPHPHPPYEDLGASRGRKSIFGDSGKSFAMSLFKSFFRNRHASRGAGTLTQDMTTTDNSDNEEQDPWESPSNYSPGSQFSPRDEEGSCTNSCSDISEDTDRPRGQTAVSGHTNSVASLQQSRLCLSPRNSSSQNRNVGGRGWRKMNHPLRRRRHKTFPRQALSPWCDVPSFTALARELVSVFNLIFSNVSLGVDVRLGVGLLLPSIVLRGKQLFRLYEGHVLIGSYFNLLLQELQYRTKPSSDPDGAAENINHPVHDSEGIKPEKEERRSEDYVASLSGRAHLTQKELIDFASRVIEALEQAYKIIGVTPLRSEAAALTELPLYFFLPDSSDPLGIALEGVFTRVIVLWLIALVGAQNDEDVDQHAMEVLLNLMSRAVSRGSLPNDSSTTLVVTSPAGAKQSTTTSSAAVSSGGSLAPKSLPAGQSNARREALSAGVENNCDSASMSWKTPKTADSPGDVPEPGLMFRASREPLRSSLFADTTMRDAEVDVCPRHPNEADTCATQLVELPTVAGLEVGSGESRNTAKALSLVFRALLSRSENLLSPTGLSTVLSLFTSHDSNLSRLGRECMAHSLETPSVYPLYADVILGSDAFLLTQTLSVISSHLMSAALTPITRRERRLWMQRSGCVDAVIRVLVRILESPQSTPSFINVTQHIFEFLSVFDSGDRKPPQLSDTNFIASVTERLSKLEGIEYFIVLTQAVLDASVGIYGGIGCGHTHARNMGGHHEEILMFGNFHLTLHNSAVQKPIFLELLPSLLTFAQSHSDQLFANIVDALLHILECTSTVDSKRLADFALEHRLTQLLPYLELPRPYVEERMPFAGTAEYLHSFWKPILLHAPRRSQLRFTSHGGVQVSVGMWPETGFSISAWFKFDRMCITIPLFEFHGVMREGSASSPAVVRGSAISASLFVFGGDSVQFAVNDGRRVTINEKQALQNFCPKKWLHACVVLRTAHVLDVYVSGFKVGSTVFPYFVSGSEGRVNIGCTDEALRRTTLMDADTSPLFSIGDIVLWARALSRSQVEEALASNGDSQRTTVDEAYPGSFPAKILEENIPQELTLSRQVDTTGGAPTPGSLGNAINLTLGGLGMLMNPKVMSSSSSGVTGPSFAGIHNSTTGPSGDLYNEGGSDLDDVHSAFAARLGRFVPYENEDNLLHNVLAYPTSSPVVAKLVGQYATPPKTWVDYPLLWATRGGIVRMLDWMYLVTSSAELEDLLELIFTCLKRTTLAVTIDPRTYLLFSYMLTNHAACYMTNTACDQLLGFASSHINVFDQEHSIIINRLAFEHVLGDVRFYSALRVNTALYLLQRVRSFFQTSHCRYARYNARVVSPGRFIDGLLHSLIGVASRTSLLLHRAVVQVAQQVVVASGMEDGLVQIFVSLIALLTPEEMMMRSQRSKQIRVTLPGVGTLTRRTVLPPRTANHLATLLLSSLLECSSQSSFVSALSHSVDLPWYAACVSRFADPVAVVYATRIFFKAVQHNPVLQEEVAQHQSAVVEALTVHAVHEDLILLMLALTMGTINHIDILSQKHSLHRQLDSVLNSLSPEPNALVAPIFLQLLAIHIQSVVHFPWQRRFKTQAVLHGHQRLAYRVQRYFSLVRVCSRIMILIRVRRYRAFLIAHWPFEASASSLETPMFPMYGRLQKRICESVSGVGSSRNVSFASNSGQGAATAPSTAAKIAAPADSGSRTDALPVFLSTTPLGDEYTTAKLLTESDEVSAGVALTAQPHTPTDLHMHSCNKASADERSRYGDELQGNQTPPSDMAGHSHPATLPDSSGTIHDMNYCESNAGVSSVCSEWKPSVYLPDMWAALPPSTSVTETAMSDLSTPQAPPAAASREMTEALSLRNGASPGLDAPPLSSHSTPTLTHVDKHIENDATIGHPSVASTQHLYFKKGKTYRVHSHVRRRAFAALRVCVLLWVPIQVQRCGWIFTPHASALKEEYERRHAGTLFCLQMMRRFASLSKYFYLFVSSPMQAGSLSLLLKYISSDMLQEQLDMWDQVVSSMMMMPARTPIEVTTAAAAPAPVGITESGVPQPVRERENTVLSALHQTVRDSAPSADNIEDDKREKTVPLGERPNDSLLDGTQRTWDSVPSIPQMMDTTMLPIPGSDSDAADDTARQDAAQGDRESDSRFSLPLLDVATEPPLHFLHPSPRNACGAKSSPELRGAAFRQENQVDANPEVTGEEQPPNASKEYSRVSDSANTAFDIEKAYRSETNRSTRRYLPDRELPSQSLQETHYAEAHEKERGSRVASETATITLKEVEAAASTTNATSMGIDDVSTVSKTKLDASFEDHDEHDNPSVSSGSMSIDSHTSVLSTSSATASVLPSTLDDAKEAVSVPFATSNPPAAAAAQRGLDPANLYAVNVTRLMMSVSQEVRGKAVTILGALIGSSLHTLPVSHWIGGPIYGSCGGLLFQLLFLASTKADAVNSTNTVVRYFLLCVGDAVKEQRDRDLIEDPHLENKMLPMMSSSFVVMPPLPVRAPLNSSGAVGIPTTAASGCSKSDSGGGPHKGDPFTSATPHAAGVLSATGSSHTGGSPHFTAASGFGGNGESAGLDPQRGDAPLSPMMQHVPRRSNNSNPNTTVSGYSDVFLLNVSRFTELIVDMLTINVLDLPMATHFFLTLLVLCQGWPSRYVDQLSAQVMRACIAVLNRPSTQDASLSLIESVYTLSTSVLRRGWKHKGVLESLLRVLYRIFVSLPPAWMPDADARHRKRLITLIYRHLVQTYAGTKELAKALTVRTLTQRLSLYDDFMMIFSLKEDECCATFEQYCIDEVSSLETLMSGRPKTMADVAFKASIKTRSEYIKRIKAFSSQCLQVTEVGERYRCAYLRAVYVSRFSSFVDATPHVDPSQLHWLLSATCALGGSTSVGHTRSERISATATGNESDSSETVEADDKRIGAGKGEGRALFHFMDPQMNYGELKSVSWGEECAPQPSVAEESLNISVESDPAGQRIGQGLKSIGMKEDMSGSLTNTISDPTGVVKAATVAAKSSIEKHLSKNDLVCAGQCEERVHHIAALVPPLITHCRPHIANDAFAATLKDLSISLTPSAMTLLRYLVAPHETVRFLSNGFRINGIHATPCLILLTNVTLKVIGFSRVTEAGDIILCEHETEDDDAQSRGAASEPSILDDSRASLSKTTRKNPFSMSSMTKQLRKLFDDNPTKRRQHQDGTRVAQAVRQAIRCNYQNIYWTYLVSSIRVVRSLYYMHLDTAVQLQLYHDSGPMLSVVDAKQSMNPSARKEFIKVLKDVAGTQQCVFIGENQRAASLKLQLVRWATGALCNYEYLRFLNDTAGRTNRDLNQYPVFPWVLADYTSTTLDLGDPSTFRNFAYPMGAQTETRRGAVAQLFENTREVLDDSMGKLYPFHHGTHYSTSGGVLYFLIRVQPFTTYARLFQGGDFDLAMRLFDSVSASFASCITGPADCKELIPEFYTNGEFLANADHLNLGIKSDGKAVDDVRLPPWAKNSRQVFCAVMRYALECPYVLEHLHQWIDLVFGVRRRGPLAMERYNVFQRMTYGEEVVQALKNAETAHECDVIIAEVDNFGQTPLQLFQERHPSHRELAPIVKMPALDGGTLGSGALTWTDGYTSGQSGLATLAPSVDGASAVTLGGLLNSATTAVISTAVTAGTGGQRGATFSNLVSTGSFASGQTYTQAFCREAPKIIRMLVHAMDETQTWFVLRDPPSSVLQHPPPPTLVNLFCFKNQAVVHFGLTRTSKRIACAYSRMLPVPDTDYYFCWHEREAHLMRCIANKAAFHPILSFDPRDENSACISAVAVGPRESILLVAISSGTVYCLFPDETGNGALQMHTTLCYHHSPVTKIALDSSRHRAVTITHSAGDDEPILWRVQRSGCSFLCRLRLQQLLTTATHASGPRSTQAAGGAVGAPPVVDVAIDSVSGNLVLATNRSLLIFDNNGEPFGVGMLPSLTSIRPIDSVMLEDDNGDVGVVVTRPVICVADITAVTFHQTSEWASGLGFLLTGHSDGSLCAWRTTRLPPHAVEPGKIALVEFHTRLLSSEVGLTVSIPASTSEEPQDWAATATGRCAPAPIGRTAPLGSGSHGADCSGSATAAGMMKTSCTTGSSTGGLSCAVTALYQEHDDVPTFLIGYANGAVRQLTFEDPMLAPASSGSGSGPSGGSGGKDISGGGCVGDDRGQRR